MGVFVGTSSAGESFMPVGLENSPAAFSRDIRFSSADLGALENQPPGKNREEVVDSSRARAVTGEVKVSRD